jgi:KDO2-lipid IV(A) lauroyltransferase
VVNQLNLIFPQKRNDEILSIAKGVYNELAITFAEVFVFSKKYLRSVTEIVGIENLHKAKSLHRGILLVSGHFSNWEMGAMITVNEFAQISGVVKKIKNPFMNAYIDRKRRSSGIKTIYMHNAFKQIVSSLKRNEIVAVLMDQYARRQGVELDFLGHKTMFYKSVAQLAIKYKTPIILGFDLRKKDDKHTVYYHAPLMFDDLEQNDFNIVEVTKKVSKVLEDYIQQYPHLWLWLHRRWRNFYVV